jgi:hypothetical protein
MTRSILSPSHPSHRSFRSLLGCIAGTSLAAMLASNARADETASTRSAAAARATERPHTMAELGIGLLTLPGAEVCVKTGCTSGDASIEVDLWQMYHATPAFAVGAGATFALRPTTDNFRGEAGGFDRTHTRSYFLVEAQGRYYALNLDWAEAWIGATVGGVILSDRYTMGDDKATGIALLGPRSSTVRTEGLTLGSLLGANWMFSPNWSVGFTLRYMRWFLPHNPATTVFGDRATLADQQNVFNFGLSVAYQIAL